MLSITHFRFLNPEWFRNPQSKLELTLRLSRVWREAARLFITRVFPLNFGFGFIFWLVFDSWLIAGILSFLAFVVFELMILESWYRKRVLPQQKANIQTVTELVQASEGRGAGEIIDAIDQGAKLSMRGLANVVYVGIAAWGWEAFLRLAFPLMTKPGQFDYRDLLIGLRNIILEVDQALWEVAQEKDLLQREQMYQNYLVDYGSRVDDMDLALPTLRENPAVLKKMIELYQDQPSPAETNAKQQARYQQNMALIRSQLRIPADIFTLLIEKVRANVALRDDRRFYGYAMDYDLRMMILALAEALEIAPDQIFDYSWKELKHASH